MKSRTSANRKRMVRCPSSTRGRRPASAMRRTVRESTPSMSATSSLLSNLNEAESDRSTGDHVAMSETMKAPRAKNRRHKPHREIADTPKQRAVESVQLPLLTLVGILGRDECFMQAIETARMDRSTIGAVARRYVPKAGRGRQVILRMLEAAAAEPDRAHALARLTTLTPAESWAEEDLAPGDRVRWVRTGVGHRDAAKRIARRGAGLCLTLECPTALTGRGRLWCSTHERNHLEAERESAERSMRTLLDAAARALSL